MLSLKTSLASAPTLGAALASPSAPLQNELLRKIVEILTNPEFDGMRAEIDEVVSEDATYVKKASARTLECLFAVKLRHEEKASLLKITRQSLIDTVADMVRGGEREREREAARAAPRAAPPDPARPRLPAAPQDRLVCYYRENLPLDDLKLNYSETRGYHLTVPAAARDFVKEKGFISLANNAKRTCACSTEQIHQLNTRAKARSSAANPRPIPHPSPNPNPIPHPNPIPRPP